MDRDGQIKIKWPENKFLFLFLPCPCIVLISTALHFLIQQFSVPPGSQQTRPAYEQPLWSCPLSAAGRAWAALLPQVPLTGCLPPALWGTASPPPSTQLQPPGRTKHRTAHAVLTPLTPAKSYFWLCSPLWTSVFASHPVREPCPCCGASRNAALCSAPLRAVAQERRRTCTAALKHTTVEKKECNTPFCIGHTFPQGLTQAV